MEVWKDIEGFEGLYQISNLGNLKSLAKTIVHCDGGIHNYPERILKPATAPNGYLGANISSPTKYLPVKIHRLVAKYFVPNPLNKPEVNHKNCIKADNRAENIEWVTRKENAAHAAANNMYPQGEENHSAKLTSDLVKKIRSQRSLGASQPELAKAFGVTQKSISYIIHRKTWKHVA